VNDCTVLLYEKCLYHETIIQVILRDINDNAPSFTQEQLSVELQDPTEAGQFVVGSTAVDYDLGANGSIVYSLHGVSDGLFNLDTSTGPYFYSVDTLLILYCYSTNTLLILYCYSTDTLLLLYCYSTVTLLLLY